MAEDAGRMDARGEDARLTVHMLMYEDTDGAKSVNSVYPSLQLAEAWEGHLIKELLVDAGLASEDDSDAIAEIEQMLEKGEIGAAASAFNNLQGDQVWIEDATVVMDMPSPGETIGYV
jgi:hypothetical protein